MLIEVQRLSPLPIYSDNGEIRNYTSDKDSIRTIVNVDNVDFITISNGFVEKYDQDMSEDRKLALCDIATIYYGNNVIYCLYDDNIGCLVKNNKPNSKTMYVEREM